MANLWILKIFFFSQEKKHIEIYQMNMHIVFLSDGTSFFTFSICTRMIDGCVLTQKTKQTNKQTFIQLVFFFLLFPIKIFFWLIFMIDSKLIDDDDIIYLDLQFLYSFVLVARSNRFFLFFFFFYNFCIDSVYKVLIKW